jgi:hypothetical protein
LAKGKRLSKSRIVYRFHPDLWRRKKALCEARSFVKRAAPKKSRNCLVEDEVRGKNLIPLSDCLGVTAHGRFVQVLQAVFER